LAIGGIELVKNRHHSLKRKDFEWKQPHARHKVPRQTLHIEEVVLFVLPLPRFSLWRKNDSLALIAVGSRGMI
jgi:hypothetical protein